MKINKKMSRKMQKKLPPILTQQFRNTMYDNMWTFMNPGMIKSMINVKTSEMDDVNDDNFENFHKNTICFKGDIDEGHYVFVDKNLNYFGSYEKELLSREEDDGICHGAAIAYALHSKARTKRDREKFELIDHPQNSDEYRHNYKTILNVYIYLIESKKWDKALEKHFYNDVHWIGKTTTETQKSLQTLKEYIKRF